MFLTSDKVEQLEFKLEKSIWDLEIYRKKIEMVFCNETN